MKRICVFVCAVAIAAVLVLPVAPAYGATDSAMGTLTASADTYVRAGAPNTNEGASPILRIKESGHNRALVRFSQTEIQSLIGGGTLVSATLQMDIVENGNNWGKDGRMVGAYRLLMDWTEGNGKNAELKPSESYRGDGPGATWNCATDTDITNHKPDYGVAWEMGKPKHPELHPWVEVATDSALITKGLTGQVEWDVTADVAAFLSGVPNYGWIIIKDEENQAGHVDFSSREGDSAPRLVLTYTLPSPSELTLTSGKDTFLRQGNPNTNEGANPGLRLKSVDHNRILVAFDLSGVDKSRVTKATLTFTILDTADNWGDTGRTIDAHRLLTDWAEGNGKMDGVPGSESTRGTGAGATWNCPIDPNISNSNTDGATEWGGGNYAPATAPSVLITNGLTGEVSFDVTMDVQTGADYGWLIRKTNEGANGRIWFHSKEGIGPAPRLILEFGP
jgi:hypothetical protein